MGIASSTAQPCFSTSVKKQKNDREHRDATVSEVDDARAAVDQHDALREQRVRRTGAETEDRELDRLGHAAENIASKSPLRRPTWLTPRAHRYLLLMSAPAVGVVAGTTRDTVRRLEAAGATSMWVGGHVASPNPSPEPIVWLARLIELTTLPVGTGVVLLPLYQPAVLAKQLADLDRASGGRISVGIGVGGEYDSDFRAAGVPVQERGTRTDEAIGLLRRFWNGEPVDHRGQHYSYDDVRIHPAPHRPGGPPILVAGRKPPAMRHAAAAR